MKLLHTADFHAGKMLGGRSRNPEIAEALKNIVQIAIEEKVDAVLVAGDLFDKPAPGHEALRIVFRFFADLQQAQIPAVVIAGNHDCKRSLDAYAPMLKLAGVHVATKRPFEIIQLDLPAGRLAVACMPFAHENDLIGQEGVAAVTNEERRQRYLYHMEMQFKAMKEELSQILHDQSVLMMHLSMEGASAGEEKGYQFDRDHDFVITNAQAKEVNADYVALGHIHRPQNIVDRDIRYSGSIVQLDFGERSQKKSVCIAELFKDKPTKVTEVPLLSCKNLVQISVKAPNIPENIKQAQEMYPEAFGDDVSLVKVRVIYKSGEGNPLNKEKASRCFPKMTIYDSQLQDSKGEVPTVQKVIFESSELSNEQLFREFCQQKDGQQPSDLLMAAFREAELAAYNVLNGQQEGDNA